jgi:hypothetical protein
MTKTCTLKESFIEKQLDKFQPGWRQGEDIKQETKDKIKQYVASKMPEDIRENAECITDYSIRHMANKIRTRENLPKPNKTNKGTPTVCEGDASKVSERTPMNDSYIEKGLNKLIEKAGWEKVMQVLEELEP